jgi:hypothetical protein
MTLINRNTSYIFIELYSKSLLKCLLIFYNKFPKKKLRSVLFELGKLIWNCYWIFNNHSSLTIINIEYIVSVYFEYISQCIDKFRSLCIDVKFEKMAKIFCYEHILKKYKYRIKPFSYDSIQYNRFYIIKNRIDIYVLKYIDILFEDSEYFAKFLIVLHKKYGNDVNCGKDDNGGKDGEDDRSGRNNENINVRHSFPGVQGPHRLHQLQWPLQFAGLEAELDSLLGSVQDILTDD